MYFRLGDVVIKREDNVKDYSTRCRSNVKFFLFQQTS